MTDVFSDTVGDEAVNAARVARPPVMGMVQLSPVSTADLQNLDRALRDFDGSHNRLLNVSADLLALCGVMVRMSPAGELGTTRMEVSRAIIDLKYRAINLDYPPSVAENLCLLFAIVIDEFVMLSPWSKDRGWENRSLVADLFGFRDGGDRFYSVAERALRQPKALTEFLEIIYIFLKLGYRGKYTTGNESERDQLLNRIETALNLVPRHDKPAAIGRPIQDTKPPRRIVPASRKIAATVGLVLSVALVVWGARSRMDHLTYQSFSERREIAQSESAVDYIYSSESGTVVTRVRP